MAKVVILGAGLTGLSTAYHFEKNNFFDFKIFEKEKNYGGLCRSVKHEDFTFDFTGHLLHCNNSYFRTIIDTLLPAKDRLEINRNSCVYMHDTFSPYPFQMNLQALPPQILTECLCGFAKRKHYITNPKTFYEWVLKHFGTGMAKHFFVPFNEKLWHYDAKKICASWTKNFVPKITIEDIIKNLTATNNKPQKVGYNHSFYYPKKDGIEYFTTNLRKQITNPIQTEHHAEEINLKEKHVTFKNGHVENFDILISTIPLNTLLKQLKEPASLNLKQQHRHLLCNAIINFNIGFKPENFTDKHWVYVPERKYHFYRLGFWHNFSPFLAKKGHSSMYGELSYQPSKQSYSELKPLVEKSIRQATSIFGINKKDIVTKKTLHLPHAYVMYNTWRENNIEKLHGHLHEQSVFSVGRYGAWKYSSMQDAILDGKNIVEQLINKKTKTLFIPAKEFITKQEIFIPTKQPKQKKKYGEAK